MPFGLTDDLPASELIECANVPKTIETVIASDLRLATFHELSTVYSVEDMWNLIEVISVHNGNKMLISKRNKEL